jgi:hypothetical protein
MTWKRPLGRRRVDGGDDYDRLVEAGEILLGTQDVLATQPVAVAPEIRLSDDLAALRDGDRR